MSLVLENKRGLNCRSDGVLECCGDVLIGRELTLGRYMLVNVTMGVATPTAWLKSGADTRNQDGPSSARRDPPPLRFGAALFCVVSRLWVGRDVGFAKSGFRPTGSHGHSPSSGVVSGKLRYRTLSWRRPAPERR
jgi:hypothetical protein